MPGALRLLRRVKGGYLMAREWTKGLLAPLYADDAPEEFREIGEYIAELHTILWNVVRVLNPAASGDLGQHVLIERENPDGT